MHLTRYKFAAKLVEPVVLEELIQSEALLRLLNQHAGQQVQAVAAIVLPLRRIESQLVFAGHANGLLLTVVVKGQRRAQKSVHNASKTPHVTLEGVGLFFKNLGGHVA